MTNLSTTYTINDLRVAVINDYAKLCVEDGGTQADEISLADYVVKVVNMSVEDLIEESWFIEGSEDNTLEGYIDCFLPQSRYALEHEFITNDDGSTTLLE